MKKLRDLVDKSEFTDLSINEFKRLLRFCEFAWNGTPKVDFFGKTFYQNLKTICHCPTYEEAKQFMQLFFRIHAKYNSMFKSMKLDISLILYEIEQLI
jgi:hypothetical protein